MKQKCKVLGCQRPIDYRAAQLCRNHYMLTPKQKDRVRRYVLENRERISRVSKRYKRKHRKYFYEYNKRYFAEHKEAINAQARKTGQKPKNRFVKSKCYAKIRRLDWDISFKEYKILCALPCFYCGKVIASTGIGLDRLDNSNGYLKNNVVPCCRSCNVIRSDILTPAETLYAITCLNQMGIGLATIAFEDKLRKVNELWR